jgi:hypothetical protein
MNYLLMQEIQEILFSPNSHAAGDYQKMRSIWSKFQADEKMQIIYRTLDRITTKLVLEGVLEQEGQYLSRLLSFQITLE